MNEIQNGSLLPINKKILFQWLSKEGWKTSDLVDFITGDSMPTFRNEDPSLAILRAIPTKEDGFEDAVDVLTTRLSKLVMEISLKPTELGSLGSIFWNQFVSLVGKLPFSEELATSMESLHSAFEHHGLPFSRTSETSIAYAEWLAGNQLSDRWVSRWRAILEGGHDSTLRLGKIGAFQAMLKTPNCLSYFDYFALFEKLVQFIDGKELAISEKIKLINKACDVSKSKHRRKYRLMFKLSKGMASNAFTWVRPSDASTLMVASLDDFGGLHVLSREPSNVGILAGWRYSFLVEKAAETIPKSLLQSMRSAELRGDEEKRPATAFKKYKKLLAAT